MDNEAVLKKEFEKIDNIEAKISKATCHELKANLLYFLITLKKASPIKKIRNSIYIDIKNFTDSYITYIDKKQFGYDEINLDKITDLILNVEGLSNQYKLLLFTYRKLIFKGFESEASLVKEKANKLKGKILLKDGKWLKALIHQCSYSFKSIIITLSVLLLICCIVLFPAPFAFMEVFNISYNDYSSNFIVNHVLNIVSSTVLASDGFKVTTSSLTGVLSLFLFKVMYVVFIINFLFEKIKNFMNNN